jgi:hypothetical protein
MALTPFRSLVLPVVLAALPLACDMAWGAEPARKPVTAPVTEPEPLRNEPVVQHIVINDADTRIEELHVRGEAKRITVKPKGAPRLEYEVIPAGGERDMTPGPGSSRGAAGQRVWNVLNF